MREIAQVADKLTRRRRGALALNDTLVYYFCPLLNAFTPPFHSPILPLKEEEERRKLK